jgi:hypothetical protein
MGRGASAKLSSSRQRAHHQLLKSGCFLIRIYSQALHGAKQWPTFLLPEVLWVPMALMRSCAWLSSSVAMVTSTSPRLSISFISGLATRPDPNSSTRRDPATVTELSCEGKRCTTG